MGEEMKTVLAIASAIMLTAASVMPAQAANVPVRTTNDAYKCCFA